MEVESALQFSVASVVEDVLQQHGIRSRGIDLESRKAEEAASRRNEAAGWLRKMIGVVAARDLPAEPSEEEFRLGLRSGLILCNVLNKVQAGAVPKVVETPSDASLIPDGAALSAFQYFENVKNFLDAAQELGLPTFEVSDLEEGGKSVRIVNSVLALKSFYEWKLNGGNGVWKFGGNVKSMTSVKSFVRKTSEPFTNSLSRTSSANDKSVFAQEIDNSKLSSSGSLGTLVRAVLLDKKPEEVPMLVESVLTKVMEEFEQRIIGQNEAKKANQKDVSISQGKKTHIRSFSRDTKVEDKNAFAVNKDMHEKYISDEKVKAQSLKQQLIVEKQQLDISDLKETLHTTKVGMQFMQKKLREEFHTLGVHIHGLAHAASGYHRVLEENRKLYNQVQDLKGSIRVYCRVRPFLADQTNHSSTVDNIEEGEISINTPSKYGKACRSFRFNKVFGPSASQAEVFADTQPLIRSVVDGYNVCIFAYGQTGSGKTFTMTGPKDLTGQSQGVNFRALHDLFLLAEQRKDTFRYDISVQMIEIYNEQVRDLLVTDGSSKRLEIRNSAQTGLNVPEANLVPVSSTSDVIYLMNLGHKNRAVGATALNDRSSRSHSCLTVHVQGRDLTSGNILRGCMHLVDLAGSERVDKSEVTGDRLKEAQHINKSLSALGDVIASLAQKNPHVPYRNSKLTQLLQDSLGGQAKTLMFVHISPELDAVGETLSTLKFAERVATVELGAARVNKDSADVKELKEQIANLKAALARKKGEPEQIQLSGGSDRSRLKSNEASNFFSNQVGNDALVPNRNACRQPMGDVGNIEVKNNSVLRQKKASLDLEDPLVSSPPWPPVIVSVQDGTDEDREVGSVGWVDKVMVNKQDAANEAENPLGCWEADSNLIFQKYLQDPSKMYSGQSYNIFPGKNLFDTAMNQDLDEDAGTSDSSEPDLLWQYNQSRLPGISNVSSIASKIKKPSPKMTNSVHSTLGGGPSPSHKPSNGVVSAPIRGRRAAAAMQGDAKRKTGNRK